MLHERIPVFFSLSVNMPVRRLAKYFTYPISVCRCVGKQQELWDRINGQNPHEEGALAAGGSHGGGEKPAKELPEDSSVVRVFLCVCYLAFGFRFFFVFVFWRHAVQWGVHITCRLHRQLLLIPCGYCFYCRQQVVPKTMDGVVKGFTV